MALNLTNIDYAGSELALEVVRESFDSSVIHKTFGARIINGVKGKGVWHNASIDLVVEEGKQDCPTFSTDYGLNQNEVLLCERHTSGKIAHDALVNTYRERFLREGVLNEQTPQDTELFAALVRMLTDAVAERQGIAFLTDSTEYDACADGLLAQFEDSTLANPVPAANLINPSSGGAAIAPATVQAELSKVINALPSKYRYGTADVATRPRIAVSFAIMDAYEQSLTYQAPTAAAGGQGPNPQSGIIKTYRGYELVPLAGLADEEMFMTPPSNIALVFDRDTDLNNLIVRNALDDSNLCKEIRWRLDWRAGSLFGKGDAVVYYRP